jgi:hypothetical protein
MTDADAATVRFRETPRFPLVRPLRAQASWGTYVALDVGDGAAVAMATVVDALVVPAPSTRTPRAKPRGSASVNGQPGPSQERRRVVSGNTEATYPPRCPLKSPYADAECNLGTSLALLRL